VTVHENLGVVRAIAGILLVAVLMSLSAQAGAQEKQVLAFYYPWYGTPDGPGGNGRMVHWGTVDAGDHDISESTHYPASGPYDSHDPAVIDRHCRWAVEAGLDGFIVSWWGHGSYEDRAMPAILAACQEHGLTACVYYERVPEPVSAQSAAEDVVRVLTKYGNHLAYLKADGRPVVFVYGRAVNDIGMWAWHEAIAQIQSQYPGGAALIGDQMSFASASVFDGIHTYNTAASLQGLAWPEVGTWAGQSYPNWVGYANQLDKISTLTVIPGYDDTKIRTPGLAVERFEGLSYSEQWERAIAADPNWVLITSFNEWHEGSEIEPSWEDGDKYIRLTRPYAAWFKSAGTETTVEPEPSLSPTQSELLALQDKLHDISIAVLPDPGSTAFWWLLGVKSDVRILTWEEIAAGALVQDSVDLLLYCTGETYRRTVQTTGDVDAAILAYLQAGGSMAVLPYQPMPFFYDENHEAVANFRKFGLSLGMGWEQPSDVDLTFRQEETDLPHVPDRLAFPSAGDQRWRPFQPESVGRTYQSLLKLRDGDNRDHGDGLVIFQNEHGGWIAYSWFRLLEEQTAPGLLYDLFEMLAERI